MNYSEYKSFVCYRRPGAEFKNGRASTALADFIKSLENGECTEELGRIFYEETATCNYKKDIPAIMKAVDTFIICICPGFFDRTIGKYRELGGDRDAFCAYAEKEDVPFLEISEALKYDMNFLPIYVDCVEGTERISAYSYVGRNLEILSEIFGDSFDNLIHKTNIPVAEYSMEKDELSYPRELEKRVTEYITNNYMSPAERENILKPMLKRLKMYYDNLVTDDTDINIDRFLPMDKNEPDIAAYRRILSKYDDVYHISSAYISGVRCMKDDYSARSDHTKFVGSGFEDVSKSCHIKPNNYVYWPVEFYGEDEGNVGISICALCFGALMLRHYLKSDKSMLSKVLGNQSPLISHSSYVEEKADAIRAKIEGAFTLLTTLRDYEDFSWMSEWCFADKLKKGTVNQTTLSVSTILSLGFLDPATVPDSLSPDERREVIFNRFLYVKGSIEWLREQCITRFRMSRGYFFAGNTDGSPTESVALTTFTFDVYMKLLKDITYLLQSSENFTGEHKQKLVDEQMKLTKDIRYILDFFVRYTNENIDKIAPGESRAICDFARALRSLTDFITSADMFDDSATVAKCAECATEIFRRIYSLSNADILACQCAEDMNVITESGTAKQTEHYEHCGSLITIDAIIKAGASLKMGDIGITATGVKEKAAKLLCDFTDNSTEYAGVRYVSDESDHYPIYALYYYRTAVYDFYKYFYERFF